MSKKNMVTNRPAPFPHLYKVDPRDIDYGGCPFQAYPYCTVPGKRRCTYPRDCPLRQGGVLVMEGKETDDEE